MYPLFLLAILQSPAPTELPRIYQTKINDTLTLVVSAGGRDVPENVHLSQLNVGLFNRGKPQAVIGGISEPGWHDYRVLRSDDSSLVVARLETYNSGPTAKLFIDPTNYHVVKQIDYPPDVGLAAVNDSEVAAVLAIPPEVVRQLEHPSDPSIARDSSTIPQPLRDHPMPQSTYAVFARARPNRVKDGYVEEGTTIEETLGPYQIVGSRIWFGKTFYDGEGTTGVGGLGYFDTGASRYTMLPLAQMAGWSTSALLIESDVIWAALVGYPEGEAYGGGLIRYDVKSRRTRSYPTDQVISQIFRFQDRLLLTSPNGAYQLKDNTLFGYRVEPNINNRFILVTDTVPRSRH